LKELGYREGITSHTNIAGRKENLISLPTWQRNSWI
jgi:hypothetical protein